MKILKILKPIPIIGYISTQLSIFLRKYRVFLKNKKYIQRNSRFENKYNGERCFILGNGPSLNKQDLSLLEGQTVFTVNNMMATEEYKKIKPSFHVLADTLWFEQGDGDTSGFLLKKVRLINQEEIKPICIFPVKARETIEKEESLVDDRIVHFMNDGEWQNGNMKKIDFTRFLPNVVNVVHLAIMAAFYMGFKDIYLLGVDMTSFLVNYEYKGEDVFNEKFGHFYKEEKGMEKVLLKAWDNATNEASLRNMTKAFEQFRFLRTYAQKKGINIVNLTNGGALDVFERKDYIQVMNNIKE